MGIKDVNDLLVYRNALKLLKPIYRLTALLPEYEEKKLRIQLTSAAKSIPALIAEGFAKQNSPKEYCRFLTMALGSSDEVITHLREIAVIGFSKIKNETIKGIMDKYRIVSRQLNSLIKTWRSYT